MANTRPVALITGAATGIGQAAAVMLAQAGYDLAIVSRTRAKLEQTAALTAEAEPEAQCMVLPADVTAADPGTATAAQIVAETLERFGRLDALINVAGYASLTPIEQITDEVWRATIDTNLSAVVMLTAAAWGALRASDCEHGAIIVNVSSMASIDPFPQFAMYAAAKAGLNMFTQCAAREGAVHGIRAVAVAPGAVETPMLRSLFDEQTIPRGKAMSPDEVAGVIRDCVTGKRAFKAGEVIVVASP